MKKIVSYLLVIILLAFLIWNILQNWETVVSIKWSFFNLNGLLLLMFLFLVYLINVVSWHMVTRALGTGVPFRKNFRVWMFSNLSRLLPGGVWQYPSRVYLLSREGVSKTLAVTAVVVESLFILSLGAATVFLSLPFWQLPVELESIGQFLQLFLFLPLAVFLLANPKIATRAAQLIKRLTGKEGKILQEIQLPFHWLLPLAGAFFARFFFTGGVLFFLTRAALPLSTELFFVVIGIYALSWLLGYITLFAPGGLGVVEVSLAALLSLYMPFTTAIVLAIAFRVILFGAEALFLSIAFLMLRDKTGS